MIIDVQPRKYWPGVSYGENPYQDPTGEIPELNYLLYWPVYDLDGGRAPAWNCCMSPPVIPQL